VLHITRVAAVGYSSKVPPSISHIVDSRFSAFIYSFNIYTRCISLNPLFFSQKNTFFFPRKQKQIYSKYLPSLTIHFSHLSGNLYTTQKKFLIFRGKPLIKPFSDVFVRIEVPLSERVVHRWKQIVRRCQVW